MAVKKRPKQGVDTKYTWILSPEYGILCYPYDKAEQTLTNLWEAQVLTAFHDAELARATKQINAILKAVEKKNKDRERKLSFILFQNRHFLVWSGYGAVGPHDDDATIVKALRLKAK
ncbi:MAG: hypothetical protein H6Q33_3388 [Deltaproteobacteria bacterium]|jgi:hypothetical protein|nr:hypothetical protein [Deltaproteobacteria bacterium]